MVQLALGSHCSEGWATPLFYFFQSLKKETIKMKGAGVEPCPLAGMITTTVPASQLLKLENCKTIPPFSLMRDLRKQTPAETFPKFPLIVHVIGISD